MIMARILIFFSLGMAILTTGIALSNRLTIGDVSFSAQVSTIIDGDTFTVIQQQKKSVIRLYGVDCPEKAQPYRKQASQAAKALLCGKVVGIDPVDTDKYGRTVAIVRLADGAALQERLVESGFAWVFDHFCRKPVCIQWKQKEKVASRAKLGLWNQKNPMPPWQWRQHTQN